MKSMVDWVTESDHSTLPMYMSNNSCVGAGAHAIWWNGEEYPEEGTTPAEMGVCSFTAEAAATESALFKVSE